MSTGETDDGKERKRRGKEKERKVKILKRNGVR